MNLSIGLFGILSSGKNILFRTIIDDKKVKLNKTDIQLAAPNNLYNVPNECYFNRKLNYYDDYSIYILNFPIGGAIINCDLYCWILDAQNFEINEKIEIAQFKQILGPIEKYKKFILLNNFDKITESIHLRIQSCFDATIINYVGSVGEIFYSIIGTYLQQLDDYKLEQLINVTIPQYIKSDIITEFPKITTAKNLNKLVEKIIYEESSFWNSAAKVIGYKMQKELEPLIAEKVEEILKCDSADVLFRLITLFGPDNLIAIKLYLNLFECTCDDKHNNINPCLNMKRIKRIIVGEHSMSFICPRKLKKIENFHPKIFQFDVDFNNNCLISCSEEWMKSLKIVRESLWGVQNINLQSLFMATISEKNPSVLSKAI